MEKNIAIQIKNVSKTFCIPHEKVNSLRGAAVSIFKDNSYEEFKALDGVSFEVKKGEFFGIIGRNGSGKSTLLKVLAGIYKPDKGKVKIDGMISPFLELGIGFNPELSGRDNVYLNATVLGMTKKQIDEKFDDIVKFSELERFIDQKLKNYSSGMQVRLAFSVSIHANRDILLMDEVLAVGDVNFQSKCLEEFNKYREMGRTVIIVTHDISVVQRYCDRAMLLRNGKIEEMGDAQSVSEAYMIANITDANSTEDNENFEVKDFDFLDKNRTAQIKKVEILNELNEQKKVFKTGDGFQIEITYEVVKPIKKLSIGVGLHAAEGGQIFGCDSSDDEFYPNNCIGVHKIIVDFPRIPLLKGLFDLNVSCFDPISMNVFDLLLKCKRIEYVTSGKTVSYRGFINTEHFWKRSDIR